MEDVAGQVSLLHDIARQIIANIDKHGGYPPDVWGIDDDQVKPLAKSAVDSNLTKPMKSIIDGQEVHIYANDEEEVEAHIRGGKMMILGVPIRVWAAK